MPKIPSKSGIFNLKLGQVQPTATFVCFEARKAFVYILPQDRIIKNHNPLHNSQESDTFFKQPKLPSSHYRTELGSLANFPRNRSTSNSSSTPRPSYSCFGASTTCWTDSGSDSFRTLSPSAPSAVEAGPSSFCPCSCCLAAS